MSARRSRHPAAGEATDLYPSLLPAEERSDRDWYGDLAEYTEPPEARPWYPEPPPLATLPSRPAMASYSGAQQTAEPIYMSPSEVAQGHKHGARDADADSVISDASLSTLAEEPGPLADAKYNQLKRTHELREKLKSWEVTGAEGGRQDGQLMTSAESGVFIEELHDFENQAKPVDQVSCARGLLREVSAGGRGAQMRWGGCVGWRTV